MYLVSRESEGDGQMMLNHSEHFLEQHAFEAGFKGKLAGLKFEGPALAVGVNNPGLIRELVSNEALTLLDLLRVRRKIKEEAVSGEFAKYAAKVNEVENVDKKSYNFILEGAVFDKASKTVDSLKDILNDKGFYVYYLALYEEMGLKRKIISLLLHRFSVNIELVRFTGLELPIIVIIAQKGVTQAANKTASLKIGEHTQTLEYMEILGKIKEQFLSTMGGVAGMGDLVAGRRVIYDANDPSKDEVIPFYTIKILDSKDKAMLNKVKYVNERKLMLASSFQVERRVATITIARKETSIC